MGENEYDKLFHAWFPDISEERMKEYAKRESWTVEEAAAISMGKDPKYLTKAAVAKFTMVCARMEARRKRRLALH